MKRRSTFPPLVFLILAAIVATTRPSSAVAPDQGASAFGEGGFSFFTQFGIENWGYSFDVVANKNGHARGRAIFGISRNSTQTEVVVKINCLKVIADPSGVAQASFIGTVLHSDDPEFPKRETVIFSALDSRDSTIFHSDIITRLFVFPEANCDEFFSPLTFFLQSPDAIHIEP